MIKSRIFLCFPSIRTIFFVVFVIGISKSRVMASIKIKSITFKIMPTNAFIVPNSEMKKNRKIPPIIAMSADRIIK